MLARRHTRRPTARRGAILLVVLAMLALFAVVALSFVLYAESEATSMRNGRAARNAEADPDPQEVSNNFLGQITLGTNNTDSAVYGHDLATAKFGAIPGQMLSPYSGNGLVNEDVSSAVGLPAGTLNRTGCVNYTRNAAGQFVNPNILTIAGTPFNKSTPYTYPDRANFYLAMQDPTTGEIVQPSFHRPDLFGSLDLSNPNWTSAAGRYLLVRPRPQEHPNFPPVPADSDGVRRGDVQNMRYIAGATQKNDSLWMYTGSPVKTWRNKRYVSMIAPLVIDLSSRVNMSVVGNNRNAGAHASNQGWGPWEVNPTLLGIDPAEFQRIVAQRYTGVSTPPAFPPAHRYSGSTSGTINRSFVPPQYSRIDSDGVGSGAADPMGAPGAGTYNPFLAFTARFADTQANFGVELADHPQTFNPFHWPRGPQLSPATHVLGMDDLVRLATRYIDPKNRYAQTELGTTAPVSFTGNAPVAMQNRALTTPFNVTQSWAEVRIATAGGFAMLGPIDLNRPLGDYRTNPAQPYSPSNVDAVTPGSNYSLARAARQRLAMDIFLRLAALSGLVDGTNVTYNPLTHLLNNTLDPMVPAQTVQFNALQRLAQYAANTVDIIDADDIKTAFVWNPVAPAADPGDAANFPINAATPVELGKRVVYGTELPRLVINEAYCLLENNRAETPGGRPLPPQAMGRAQKNLEKKYWIELHNPLPVDAAIPTANVARLQYVNNVSPGANATYPVYVVEVAEITPPAANQPSPAQPLYDSLVANPSNVLGDPGLVGAPLVTKLRVDNYTYDATPTTPPATLTLDDLNIVYPTAASTGPDASNKGYYVLGPVDKHPSDSFKSSMRLADPPANAPAPQNAMLYDMGVDRPTQANIDSAKKVTSTVVLRRLANPYLPPQTNAAMANYNPYITVDFLENVPTRDRVKFTTTGPRANPLDDSASIGRRHPYASMPAFDRANPDLNMVVQQMLPAANTTSPPHSFFSANYSADPANAGTYIISPGGFAPLIHFDRELINSVELMHVSIQAPHSLTSSFGNGTLYNLHTKATPTNISALVNDLNYPAAGLGTQMFKAFDLLTTANRLPGIPVGGREPGRVNINTAALPATDARILQAVLDPQAGNSFDATFVSTAWQTTAQPLRTPNWGTAPYVRGTFDETGAAGADRPYKLAGSSTGYDETLFRSPTASPGQPMLFNYLSASHPYLQAEPHRKAWNNLTAVSDGFLVIWTVGFFEVESPVGAPVLQIGQELFKDVPGDLRKQYSAVVDRSMLTVASPLTPAVLGPKPWETKLMADAPVGSTTVTVEGIVNGANLRIYNDGVPVDVTPGSQLRLGTSDTTVGGEGEFVNISTVGTPIVAGALPGQVVITLDATTPTLRFHGGSSRVSNALPGNPGSQPAFDPNAPANKHLIPFFTKLDP